MRRFLRTEEGQEWQLETSDLLTGSGPLEKVTGTNCLPGCSLVLDMQHGTKH